jgi:hypothetical protein
MGGRRYQSVDGIPDEPSCCEHQRLEKTKVKTQAKQVSLSQDFQTQPRHHRHGERIQGQSHGNCKQAKPTHRHRASTSDFWSNLSTETESYQHQSSLIAGAEENGRAERRDAGTGNDVLRIVNDPRYDSGRSYNELRLTIIYRPCPGAATVMKDLPLSKVYQLLEPGPVVLLTTARKGRANVMTMSWHMMVEFEPPLVACVVSGANYSFAALRTTKECVIAIPALELAPKVVAIGNCSGRGKVREIRAVAGASRARGADCSGRGFRPWTKLAEVLTTNDEEFMRVLELHALERFSSLWMDRRPMQNSRVFASKWSSN